MTNKQNIDILNQFLASQQTFAEKTDLNDEYSSALEQYCKEHSYSFINANTYIREHFDGFEKYKITTDTNEIVVKRVKRSGKNEYAPQFRFCDIAVEVNNNTYDFNDFSNVYVKEPFIGVSTNSTFHTLSYSTIVNVDIDDFTPDTIVNLICVSNNLSSQYDGHISTVMFTGVTSYDSNDNQVITITDSTLKNYENHGDFVCTVFKDEKYSCVGGLVTISVTENAVSGLYSSDGWFRLPSIDLIKYREVPDEFKITLNGVTVTEAYVTLQNKYIKDYSDTIDVNNSNLYNMNEYYYDDINYHRLPISDTRIGDNKKRLVIDTTLNPNVKLIKSPFLNVRTDKIFFLRISSSLKLSENIIFNEFILYKVLSV